MTNVGMGVATGEETQHRGAEGSADWPVILYPSLGHIQTITTMAQPIMNFLTMSHRQRAKQMKKTATLSPKMGPITKHEVK